MGRIRTDPRGPGIYARIYPDFKRCTGCRICEIVCSMHKFGTINPEYSRIRVIPFKGVDIPVLCRICADPKPCIQACPASDPEDQTNSILYVDEESGAVIVDADKCVELKCDRECSTACPAKAIFFHPQEKYPLICDLCGGDPECVKECPEGCLEFIAGPADYLSPENYAYPPEKIAEFLMKSIFYYKGREEQP